jgi:hypothetical protein
LLVAVGGGGWWWRLVVVVAVVVVKVVVKVSLKGYISIFALEMLCFLQGYDEKCGRLNKIDIITQYGTIADRVLSVNR